LKLDSKWSVLLIISLGIFITTLDGSILSVANPTIAFDLGVSMQNVQWVVTSYLLVITSSLIFFGRLGDKLGNNTVFTYGFLIFTLGSLACSMSGSLPLLIAARLFQGIGGSMMMATGIGIVSNIFPAAERGKALGLTGTVVALGNMLGPGVGGLLLGNYPWPFIFLLNIPLGLLGFYLGLRYLPAFDPERACAGYDFRGTIILALSLTSVTIALAQSPTMNIGLLLSAAILLLFFFFYEKKTPYPLLDFDVFKSPTFVYGNLVAIAVYCTHTSVFFLLPFYLEQVMNYSSVHTGILMTIPPIVMAITAPLAGYFSDKFGSPRIIGISLTVLAAAFYALSTLGNTAGFMLSLGVGLVLLGIGLGMFGSPNTSSIMGSIPRQKAGYGGGFLATTRNLSYSLGIASSVSFFSWMLQKKQVNLDYVSAYIEASHYVYLYAAFIISGVLVLFLLFLIKPRSS